MPTRTPYRWTCLFVSALFCAVDAFSQNSPVVTVNPDEPLVVLDPFKVESSASEGYRTQSSASGLGFKAPIDRVPIPLTVLTPRFIADSGSIKVEDALRYVSGVSNSDRTSRGESYVIRGFATGNLLRDGEIFNTPTDSALIERVEVIKGPAAIIYGTADPSGLVNIIQKQPGYRAETIFEGTYGEYGTYRGMIDVNQPIATSGALRAAARVIFSQYKEGFPRPNEERDRWLIAPALRLDYGKNTTLEARFNYAEENGRLNRIQTPFLNTGEGGSVFARGFVPVRRDFTFVTPNDDWDHRDEGVSLRLVQHLGKDTTLQLAFVQSQIDATQYFNLGNGRIQANSSGQFFAGNNFMVVEPRQTDHRGVSMKLLHELRLGKTDHKISLGYRDNRDTDYAYAYYDSRVSANTPPLLIADASGPYAVSFPGAPRTLFDRNEPFATNLTGTTPNTNPNPVRVTSGYLSDYITLINNRLNLLLGAHFVDIKTQKKDSFAPQVGVVYQVIEGLNLYALSSESFRPNGPQSTVNPALGFFDPEQGRGLEAGLKFNTFGGRLSGTLAAYEIERKNIVQFIGGVFNQNNNVASGKETSEGLELDLVYAPLPELSFMFGYAYTDAYISEAAVSASDANNPDANGDGRSDAIGLSKEGVAKHDIRLWSSYDFKAGPLNGLTLGGGFTWRKGPIQQFPTYIHRFVREEGDPTRLDLFAAYRTKLAGYDTTFRVNWQNVTNELYRDRRAYFVTPSTVQFTAQLRF